MILEQETHRIVASRAARIGKVCPHRRSKLLVLVEIVPRLDRALADTLTSEQIPGIRKVEELEIA